MGPSTYVSAVTTHPSWSPDNIRILSAPTGAPGVGSRYRTVGFSVVRGADSEADLEVTIFDAPTRFGFVATSGPQAFENVFTFDLALQMLKERLEQQRT